MKKPIIPKEFSHYYNDWHFAPAVKIDKFVFFSGATGTRPDRSISSDPEAQFREAFETVLLYLTEATLSFDDVVEMTTYHVSLRKYFDTFTKVKDEYVKDPYPAWSAIGVSELITEGALVEIRVIAYRS
ncbi:RidA family protein [Leptolyngbyaceae cyanobacterium CCMR0082]|uniref:RidA family protein n=2 Tax=Adonisia turfae TaxID=2950184 RepID=A0A6M0SFT2_9CYAN|nr:RidA family protein [Adonisia turfae]MDV3347280.1 RidA family protein [Leptothoe sp. LEGE 181152]NEZ56334.1 RidA family protein [Adonisia turfae CCMR0081]NEZ66843.1 RidA family protein [Adonisia turfae CCMR0082]